MPTKTNTTFTTLCTNSFALLLFSICKVVFRKKSCWVKVVCLNILCPQRYGKGLRRQDKITAQKMKLSIKDFLRKCDQIFSFLRIWSHLLKKSLMKTSFFAQWKMWFFLYFFQNNASLCSQVATVFWITNVSFSNTKNCLLPNVLELSSCYYKSAFWNIISNHNWYTHFIITCDN